MIRRTSLIALELIAGLVCVVAIAGAILFAMPIAEVMLGLGTAGPVHFIVGTLGAGLVAAGLSGRWKLFWQTTIATVAMVGVYWWALPTFEPHRLTSEAVWAPRA